MVDWDKKDNDIRAAQSINLAQNEFKMMSSVVPDKEFILNRARFYYDIIKTLQEEVNKKEQDKTDVVFEKTIPELKLWGKIKMEITKEMIKELENELDKEEFESVKETIKNYMREIKLAKRTLINLEKDLDEYVKEGYKDELFN